MLKDPRISDRPARDPDDVHAGLVEHPHGIFGGEHITTSQDRAIRITLLHLADRIPARLPRVLLLNGAAVNPNRGVTIRPGGFNDVVKAICGLRRIVERAAEADRRRHLWW